MSQFIFEVPGNPQPQGRPRFYRRGSFVGTYDPKESVDYKAKVAQFAIAAGVKIMEGGLSLRMEFFLKRPKYLCRPKDSDMPLPADKRPDWDNLAKAVCDALNGLAYRDDGQIHSIDIRKFYHEKGGAPRVKVFIHGEKINDD